MSQRPTATLRTIIALTAVFGATGLAACKGPASTVFKHAAGAPVRMSESMVDRSEVDAPFEVALAGPVGLDIELFNGDVTVRVNPEAEHATLTFIRGASHGYRRKDAALADLETVDYSFDIVPGDLGPVLEIRSTSDSAEAHYLRSDLEIEIPEIENIRLRTGDGDVEVRDATGTVDIEVLRGSVRYMTMRPVHSSVRIISGRGDVDFRVRGESGGAILAESIRGSVRHRVTRGRWTVKPGTSYNRLLASLNNGRNPIELRTVEGIVRFASVEDPLAVGAMILD